MVSIKGIATSFNGANPTRIAVAHKNPYLRIFFILLPNKAVILKLSLFKDKTRPNIVSKVTKDRTIMKDGLTIKW